MRTVGAYEARTNLTRLLADVEGGETISITSQGREVAKLVPAHAQPLHGEVLTALRAGVQRSGSSLRRFIDAGRR